MRQGDVSIHKAEKLKLSSKAKKIRGHYVLKHGESGNKHMLAPIGNAKVTVEKLTKGLYFEVKDGKAALIHDEDFRRNVDYKDNHKVIIIEEGNYKVNDEREVNPFTQEIKKVVD